MVRRNDGLANRRSWAIFRPFPSGPQTPYTFAIGAAYDAIRV